MQVKELVDARGWSVQELANQAGLDLESAQRLYEGRSANMDLTTLGHLCEMFNVLPNDIVIRVVEPQPSVIDTGELARDPAVPTQTVDDVNKSRPELKDGPGSDVQGVSDPMLARPDEPPAGGTRPQRGK